PVLLEQLTHERFKTGLIAYLHERIERAGRDRAEFETSGDQHSCSLAQRWESYYARQLRYFENIGRDIAARFAGHWQQGSIQLLTSNATHAYMPLMVTDQCSRAQISA